MALGKWYLHVSWLQSRKQFEIWYVDIVLKRLQAKQITKPKWSSSPALTLKQNLPLSVPKCTLLAIVSGSLKSYVTSCFQTIKQRKCLFRSLPSWAFPAPALSYPIVYTSYAKILQDPKAPSNMVSLLWDTLLLPKYTVSSWNSSSGCVRAQLWPRGGTTGASKEICTKSPPRSQPTNRGGGFRWKVTRSRRNLCRSQN